MFVVDELKPWHIIVQLTCVVEPGVGGKERWSGRSVPIHFEGGGGLLKFGGVAIYPVPLFWGSGGAVFVKGVLDFDGFRWREIWRDF